MEESFSIPSIIGNNKIYMSARILKPLIAIILTNIYVTLAISGLNAPLVGEKLENDDLYGNSSEQLEIELAYIKKHCRIMHDLQLDRSLFFTGHLNSPLEKLHRNKTSFSGFTILSEPVSLPYPEDVCGYSLYLRNPFIYSNFYDSMLLIKLCEDQQFPQDSFFCRTLISLMRPSRCANLQATFEFQRLSSRGCRRRTEVL